MSVRSAPYYWIECDHDGCTAKSTTGGDHSAWSETWMALEEADGSDWYAPSADGKHYCWDHHPRNEEESEES
ncbi:hypothetical protein SEA_BRUHMOMENT_55 [Arthrobacter phage BruhMoment]|nr:hypothetical protein SEA_BRUHMOMENT_55 [Arthrobacter phage BruhMoment]